MYNAFVMSRSQEILNQAPVYHVTLDEFVPEILHSGLKSRHRSRHIPTLRYRMYSLQIRITDELFDLVARKEGIGFRRMHSVYAEPTQDMPISSNDSILQVMVDPRAVLVAPSMELNMAMIALFEKVSPAEFYKRANLYWKTAITLEDYLKNQGKTFSLPEVMIPSPVKPHSISIYRR